jgi:hypothetical protein
MMAVELAVSKLAILKENVHCVVRQGQLRNRPLVHYRVIGVVTVVVVHLGWVDSVIFIRDIFL